MPGTGFNGDGMEEAVRALKEDSELMVVTSTLYRRRDIAAAYFEAHCRKTSRWSNSGWIRLLNRIILEEDIKNLPEPHPNLYHDQG